MNPQSEEQRQVTQDLAECIVHSQPDAEARTKARAGILDFTAVALPIVEGDINDSGLAAVRQVFQGQDAQTRALMLGYAGHALDFDDFHADFRGHPSTVILPVLFALAREIPGLAGEQLLDAYIIGIETAGRLGLAAGPHHYLAGFHNTATLGTLAAAAAAARLLNASVTATANLLGIAATRASGLRAQFASAVKPLHAGFAAQSAVIACQLSLAGLQGQHSQVLEAFLASSGGGQQRPDLLTANWAAPWRIVTPGLEFKPYPTCAGTHSAADAARQLRNQWLQHSAKPLTALYDDLSSIVVTFPPGGDIAASVRQPASGVEARFSLEYVIAASLLNGQLRLQDFTEGPVQADIAALATKVQRCPDISAPPDEINPGLRFHQVTLYRQNGEQLQCCISRQQSLAMGIDLQQKLHSCLPTRSALQRDDIVQLCQLATPAAVQQLACRLTTFAASANG